MVDCYGIYVPQMTTDMLRYQREVIRIRISKKNRQDTGKWKSPKGQTTIYKTYTHITKDRVTRTPLKPGESNHFL
jgi:hypothetical protein